MDAGPARRRSAGFSLAELLVTLLVLGLAAWLVLRLVDRRTRVATPEEPLSGPAAVLAAGLRAIASDVRAAGTGGLGADDAFRPVEDNTTSAGRYLYRTAIGGTVVVRNGTDQLGLRGVIRSPLVALEPRDPTGELLSDRVRARPEAAAVRLPAGRAAGAVRARLREAAPPRKTFFLLRDAAGRWAVARVASAAEGPPESAVDLVLDFTDADARALNHGGDPGAAARLGDVSAGGVFDDLVWFVAQGEEGRPPDFVVTNDPASLAFPHPYLAAASGVGGGRWDVRRAGEDVEDLQVAWGFPGPSGSIAWRGDAADSPAPLAGELADATGRARLKALKIALSVKSAHRIARSAGAPAPEVPRLFNAAPPGKIPGAAPVGWDAVPQRRVGFDRESRETVVAPPALADAGP